MTKNETKKYSTSTCITVLSNRTMKKESGGRGHQRKNEFIYLKLNKENNIRTMVLKIYLHSLIEAFKMRLLSTAESLESPKRSNSTFKWLGKFLKDELMLDMSMKRDLRAFSKLRQRRKKIPLSSTSKLQLHEEFKVSRKPCLNFCSCKFCFSKDVILSSI